MNDRSKLKAKLVFPDDIRPDFAGFRPAAFTFLRGLKRNNERAWFQSRKEIYESEIRFPMECLLAEFGRHRRPSGVPVIGDPGAGIFRVHRDVRFARDKSPYKTHCGAVLTRTGRKGDPGLVYVHIEPGHCFVSAGFYRPDPQLLTAWRKRMVADPAEFLALVKPHERKGARTYMRSISSLKTLPHGFREHVGAPIAEYLKWQHFLLTRDLADRDVQSRKLITILRDHARRAAPLLAYGWEIADALPTDDPRRHMRRRDRAAD